MDRRGVEMDAGPFEFIGENHPSASSNLSASSKPATCRMTKGTPVQHASAREPSSALHTSILMPRYEIKQYQSHPEHLSWCSMIGGWLSGAPVDPYFSVLVPPWGGILRMQPILAPGTATAIG